MGFADMPGENTRPEHADRVLHSELRIGEDVLMLSDAMNDEARPDGNVQVTLNFDDLSDMTRRFDALAIGGKVRMPLDDAFWGAKFGMLTDAFGVQWLFNCQKKA